MQAIKVVCPLCQQLTGVNDVAPLGKSIRCQKCGAPFTVGANDIRQAFLEPVRDAPAPPAATDAPATAWWVDNHMAATAPPRPLSSPAATASTPVSISSSTPPPKTSPRALPARSAAPKPAAGRALALTLVGGGLLAMMGLGVAVAVVCLADSGSEPVDPSAQAAAPSTTPTTSAAPKNSVSSGNGGAVGKAKKTAKTVPVEQPGPVVLAEPAEMETEPGTVREPRRKDEDQPAVPVVPVKQVQKDPFLDPINMPKPLNPGNKHVVSAARQREIDGAIAKGMAYLKDAQLPTGTWAFDSNRPMGTAALVTLALLECGMPSTDPCVVSAANYVRKNWGQNTATYEISLAILLMDKLGEKKDVPAIKALALRLLHGQNSVGGWSYNCDVLTNQKATDFLTMLQKNRPRLPQFIDKTQMTLPAQVRLLNPLEKASGLSLPAGIDKNKTGDKKPSDGLDNEEETLLDGQQALWISLHPETAVAQAGAGAQFQPGKGPPKGPPGMPGGPPKDGKGPPLKFDKNDDNSNTQFAMLALWAARRHNVPVENALLLCEKRFRASQHTSGGWAYHFGKEGRQTPSMTCVGLLGLALGRGITTEMQLKAGHQVPKTPLLDAMAREGFLAGVAPNLERVDRDAIVGKAFPAGLSLYFMWSVERVAVLYDQVRIGERDWYLWGVDILLPTQQTNGSWQTSSYHGSNPHVDTCFALLFLKRVNLVQDLTDTIIRLDMAIPVDGAPKK